MATLTGEQLKDSYQSLVTIGDSITSNPTSGVLENGKGSPIDSITIYNDATGVLDSSILNLSVLSNDANTNPRASIEAQKDGTNNGRLILNTSASGTLTERLRIRSGGDISFRDGSASEAFYWDASAGSLGIGTTEPATKLEVEPSYGEFDGIKVSRGAGFESSQYSIINQHLGGLRLTSVVTGGGSAGVIAFKRSNDGTTASESMRIDASGNVGIGTSTTTYDSAKIGTGHKFLNVQAPSGSYAVGTLAGDTDINGDRIGYLTFVNENNSASYKYSAWIGAEVEGATANQQGGRLIFSTASDGSSGGPIERLLIDSDGKVGIGTLLPSTTLDVKGTMSLQATNSTNKWLAYTYTDNTLRLNYNGAGNDEVLIDSSGNVGIGTTSPLAKIHSVSAVEADAAMFSDGTYYTLAVRRLTSSTGGMITGEASSALGFGTDNTERMRILSGGDVSFAMQDFSSSPSNTVYGLRLVTGTTGKSYWKSAVNADTTHYHYEFLNTNGSVGNISTSASATAYNTSSDYRLKENVVPMEGALDKVAQLKPSTFNFIADADTTVDGFLAHEVAEIVPNAVSGEKDAVDEEGNPMYQGIDHSKLVPILVGAIQELKAEIEQLKNQ